MARIPGTISLTAVGKLKTSSWKTAQDDYVKRLRYYLSFNLIEVKDSVGRSLPATVALKQEGQRLLGATAKNQRLIALISSGQQMSSPQLASFLQNQLENHGRITYLIGGPLGLSEEVLTACHNHLSLSKLTFTHEMARIFLLEQLYRACTILKGEKYHK